MEMATMLIVDDDELNREILKVLFQDNYAILEADSGEEGLAVIEACSGNIDIVLLDLVMSGLSGFDVLKERQNRESFKNVPVLVITGSSHMDDQIKAFELGASDYINKPFVPEIVVSRVNNVLVSHRRILSMEAQTHELKIKSELDIMTGVYNKPTVEYMIHKRIQLDSSNSVLFVIDIDNFKYVNDTDGHQEGDHVIKIVADLLSSQFRKSDIIGRIGGDEFVVLMTDVPSMNIVYKKVNELIQIMRYKPNLTIPANVTLSIGIASNKENHLSYSELFKRADSALYKAKEAGKACYREYGVEPVSQQDDHRAVILLISRNRSVCSVVNANIIHEARIVEVLDVETLSKTKQEDIDKMKLVLFDVSDSDEDASYKFIEQCPWIDFGKVVAIIKEGNMNGFTKALSYGVRDIITEPIDSLGLKRRILKLLEEN